MALWRATIYKESTLFPEARWSNVYTINAIDGFNALEVATNIRAKEILVSYATVRFTKIHVVDLGDTARTRSSLNPLIGNLDPAGLGGPLPLFNTIRVTFQNLEGKPEQKYLRLGANEANLSLGRWDGEFVTFVENQYAIPLQDNGQYVGPGNEEHIGYLVHPEVQNRQLGWHRRTRPGFKRGWVAV